MKTQRGFSVIEGMILVAIVSIIGITVKAVWDDVQETNCYRNNRGCDAVQQKEVDRERAEEAAQNAVAERIFMECLQRLPAGPVAAKYNDWDEVVDSCKSSAYSFARYRSVQ